MIESDHDGEITACLLPSSHSGLKNFEARKLIFIINTGGHFPPHSAKKRIFVTAITA